jgi:rhodanese-related sulfurtransferase
VDLPRSHPVYSQGMDHTPAEVMELHARGEIQLIDVRTPQEHDAGRITGDTHIEMSELSHRAGEIDPDRPVVFYCRTGSRSSFATAAFRKAGFDARNMTGGLKQWHAEGRAIEPADGFVADH